MSGTIVHYTYWQWEAALSKDFCDSMLKEFDWATSSDATIKEKAVVDLSERITDVLWREPTHPLGCIARTYIDLANQSANWDYILTGQEKTQIGRYKSSNKGHYEWHMDSFPPKDGIQRKLSCVILLNDASDFEGGVLQFKGFEEEKPLTKQGSIVVFPSFIEHKVTPVTKGVRYTAVTWAFGPSFK